MTLSSKYLVKFNEAGVSRYSSYTNTGLRHKIEVRDGENVILSSNGLSYWSDFDDKYMVLINKDNLIGGKLIW